MPTLPLLISREDAAEMLGVSLRTLDRLLQRGTLRTFKIDAHARPRLIRDEVLALAQRSVEREA